MGNRVSVSFKKDDEESVVLFSHWGGREFAQGAKEYVKQLKKRPHHPNFSTPLSRRDPETVMVDFIRHITKNLPEVDGDLYLGKDENDGDNSDNGHFTIDVS